MKRALFLFAIALTGAGAFLSGNNLLFLVFSAMLALPADAKTGASLTSTTCTVTVCEVVACPSLALTTM